MRQKPNRAELIEIYQRLELNNLLKALLAEAEEAEKPKAMEIKGKKLSQAEEMAEILSNKEAENLGIVFLADTKERAGAIGIYFNDEGYLLPLAEESKVMEILAPLLEDDKTAILPTMPKDYTLNAINMLSRLKILFTTAIWQGICWSRSVGMEWISRRMTI